MGIRLMRVWLFATAVAAATATAGSALADRRVALVIGNGKYLHAGELANPRNDAKLVGDLLMRAGFDLVLHRDDLGVIDFKRAVREFTNNAANADIAVIYYSGHGVEFDGVNYLIPIDARLAGALYVEDETVPLDRVLASTAGARKLGLIILDACRENPLRRNPGARSAMRTFSVGLADVSRTGQNTLIAYAAKAGSVSFDGDGPNSPFTAALVKYLAQPGLDIRIALGKVRDDVVAETGGKQEPFVYGSLGGENVSIAPAKSPSEAAPASPPGGVSSEALDYQFAERVGSLEAWRVFVASHPKGFYAQLAQAQIGKFAGLSPAIPAESATLTAGNRKKLEVAAPSPSKSDEGGASVVASPGDPCKQELEQLGRLRANPSAEVAQRLDKDMTCRELRPQLARLMESLGLSQSASTTPASLSPPVVEPEAAAHDNCASESAELARLRATPDSKAIKTFVASMTCSALKPQATRLIESLAD